MFFPGGFRAFATPVASVAVVDPTTGQQRFGSWMIYGVAQSLAGAAITVDAGGSQQLHHRAVPRRRGGGWGPTEGGP